MIVVDGRYWVIEDVLEGERSHRYDLRWHLAPAAARRRAPTAITGAADAPEERLDLAAYGFGRAGPSAAGDRHRAHVVTLLARRS